MMRGVLLLFAAACAAEPYVALDHDGWVLVDEPGATCSPSSFFVEEGYFEISTDGCPSGTWQQPLPPLRPGGRRVEVELFHQALWAPGVSEAVVDLSVDDTVVVSWTSPIPAEAARFDLTGRLPARGGTATLRLRNHGVNSYRLGDVVVRCASDVCAGAR
jgi:hypothetical protein